MDHPKTRVAAQRDIPETQFLQGVEQRLSRLHDHDFTSKAKVLMGAAIDAVIGRQNVEQAIEFAKWPYLILLRRSSRLWKGP